MYVDQQAIPSNFSSVFKFTTKVLDWIDRIFLFLF